MQEWVYPYIKKHKKRLSLSLFLGVLGIGSGVMLLFISGYLISKSSLRPENIMVVYVPVVSVRAFSIGQAVFLYLEKIASHDLVLRMLEKMREKLYNIVEPQAVFLRSRYQTGDLLGVLSDDIEHLQDLYLETILPSILGLIIYAITVGVFGVFDLAFALMMAFMLGIIVFLVPLVSFYVTRHHHTSMKQRRNKLYKQLTDAIFGMSDWQASGREAEFMNKIAEQDKQLLHTERKLYKWRHVRDGIIQLVIGSIVIMVMYWSAGQVDAGTISPTLIAAFTLMIFSITDALIPVSVGTEPIPSYQDSIDRINEVQNSDLPKDYMKEAKWNGNSTINIQLNNIRYRYPNNDTYTITDLSLSIPAGKKIAILGRSGTGKSTLLKLLSGTLKPASGTITVNGENMHSGLLSQAVSVLNQKPHLFSTTIMNNIRIGNPQASTEDIKLAARRAQLSTLIDSLPEGMHTPMREMGHRFSGGERQRIAFARVLLQNTPIILVDEATIGLDPHTEQDLLDMILTETKGKTVIWITHHLAGVEAMDEVIFLEDGNIAMQGTHEQLLENNRYYRKLYNMDQGLA